MDSTEEQLSPKSTAFSLDGTVDSRTAKGAQPLKGIRFAGDAATPNQSTQCDESARSTEAVAAERRASTGPEAPLKDTSPIPPVTAARNPPSTEAPSQSDAEPSNTPPSDPHLSEQTPDSPSHLPLPPTPPPVDTLTSFLVSPIDSSTSHRVIRTISHKDFPALQSTAEADAKRLRTYLVATDLSEAAAYALEWTASKFLRDGDTLLAIYAVEASGGAGSDRTRKANASGSGSGSRSAAGNARETSGGSVSGRTGSVGGRSGSVSQRGGRDTPTSSGRDTPIASSGRDTPTATTGRETPTTISDRDIPTPPTGRGTSTQRDHTTARTTIRHANPSARARSESTGGAGGISIGAGAAAMLDARATIQRLNSASSAAAAAALLQQQNDGDPLARRKSVSEVLAAAAAYAAFGLEADDEDRAPTPRTKSERSRLHAIDKISQTCLRALRKTTLKVQVAIEVIHAKSPKHMITEAIDALEPTLVILGSRGRSALKGILLGSFSNYLVTKSSVPVVVARKTPQKVKEVKPVLKTASGNAGQNRLVNAKVE